MQNDFHLQKCFCGGTPHFIGHTVDGRSVSVECERGDVTTEIFNSDSMDNSKQAAADSWNHFQSNYPLKIEN